MPYMQYGSTPQPIAVMAPINTFAAPKTVFGLPRLYYPFDGHFTWYSATYSIDEHISSILACLYASITQLFGNYILPGSAIAAYRKQAIQLIHPLIAWNSSAVTHSYTYYSYSLNIHSAIGILLLKCIDRPSLQHPAGWYEHPQLVYVWHILLLSYKSALYSPPLKVSQSCCPTGLKLLFCWFSTYL